MDTCWKLICTRRSLADALEDIEEHLTEAHVLTICQQMCAGMEVCALRQLELDWVCRPSLGKGSCMETSQSATCCYLGSIQPTSHTPQSRCSNWDALVSPSMQVSDYGLSVHTSGKTHQTVSGADLPIRCLNGCRYIYSALAGTCLLRLCKDGGSVRRATCGHSG